MSKTYVCMAPDGSLEVWYNYPGSDYNWSIIQSEKLVMPGMPYLDWISICDKHRNRSPEFWGREVLGPF